MTDPNDQSLAEAVQQAAGEQLGVERWDRSAIFRETITAASETGLTYWLVLALSGGIATLGLALDSSAVVIGAMLVAPLLAPVIGLALSLAVGDTRMAVQTGLVVVASTGLVILVSAVLTMLLPFHTITLEITSRTRPTTLDLAVAIFSGLVGALVTIGRGKRLSAAIPGVAIAVALIPPLAVAGFGIGSGLRFELIFGAMLLYGANLAGIILSGMAVFILIGMHRVDVLAYAREWHATEEEKAGARWMDRLPGGSSLGVASSTWARMGLVGGFVIALGVPLSASLQEIGREVRIERAIGQAAQEFEVEGRSFVLDRRVSVGSGATDVRLRVATTEWFGPEDEAAFELRASTLAGEPVQLVLEQLPTSSGDLDELADLLPTARPEPAAPPAPARPAELTTLLRDRLAAAAADVALPPGVTFRDLEIATRQDGQVQLRATYLAPEPLSEDAQQLLTARFIQLLAIPRLAVSLSHVEPAEPPVPE